MNIPSNLKMINKNSSHNLTARDKQQSVVIKNSTFGDMSADLGNSTIGTALEHNQRQLAKMQEKANEYQQINLANLNFGESPDK